MKYMVPALLMAAVFVSAIEVVRTQHESRKLFAEIQELQEANDDLNEEWGRLQLEQSTWATDDRIETVAHSELEMHDPDAESLVLLAE
jgi:cell division protein FtsL